ncbi:hypothetical protein CHH55_22980 [Niallia circulans]|jgi:hypothetical protein|uniref:Lipoprotein n=1 Tax=Niallia circulans TaxID=1397 RepID=A0A0J1IHJ0_NIACI|nr:hypothetical protein [Niallia circulans]KLV25449.1 hypothetical protein ABW02_15795 [Niallia circulans]MCM2982385.1 hypothetical protein [Niallia circulans]MDR4318189.1 hypothetical protein [Niallia circulans]MED3837490.1 hypothetical protein [Niallia circulans]MED4245023.1 hypothetical protein [Niallia circulans]
MKYLSLFMAAFLFLLAGCGNSAEEKKEQPVKEQTNAKQETKAKELTDEDKKFIALLEKGEYQTIIDETIGLGSDAQVNFYFLANAFKAVPDYTLSKTYLNKTKYIPAEIEDKVNKLKEDIDANVEKEGA